MFGAQTSPVEHVESSLHSWAGGWTQVPQPGNASNEQLEKRGQSWDARQVVRPVSGGAVPGQTDEYPEAPPLPPEPRPPLPETPPAPLAPPAELLPPELLPPDPPAPPEEPPLPDVPAPPTSYPPAPAVPPEDPALPPDDDPAAPPADEDPAAPPVPLLPAEPPVVDPSRAFFDDEPELEEQAIAAPNSSETTVHRPALRIPKAPLIPRP